MSVLPPGIARLRVAEGGYTDPRRRGYCDGGYIEFDQELRRWKGWEDVSGRGLVTAPTGGGNGATAPTGETPVLRGIAWLEEIGGAILQWETVALDIQLSQWRTGGGKFAVVRPPGDPSTTRLHQFDGTPELTWFAVREGMPADSPFCVSLYRESTPAREGVVDEGALPYIYTEIRFGGVYALRLPKWREAELWKCDGGTWGQVLKTSWRHAEMYNDSHSGQEMFVAVLPLDGQILLMGSNYTDQAVVWQEDRPIRLPQSAVEVWGNGGAGYIGLHEVRFSTEEGNALEEWTGGSTASGAGSATRTYNLTAWPDCVVLGSKPAGCKAELKLLQEDGTEWTQDLFEQRLEDYQEAEGPGKAMPTKIKKRLELSSTDPQKTPVVRWAGLVVKPNPQQPEAQWEDLSERVLSVDGTWQVDLKKRIGWSEYTVELDNADGGLREWVGNKRCEVSLGYDATPGGAQVPALQEGLPELMVRALGYIAPDDEGLRSAAEDVVTGRSKDRLMSLFEVQCGYRAPQDGMLVTRALQDALGWGGVYLDSMRTRYDTDPGGMEISGTDEIGVWFQSGKRLPTSRFEAARRLNDLGYVAEVGGADEKRAVCQPRPDQMIGDYIVEIMRYDPYTFLWYGNDGWFEYQNVFELGVTHYFHEVETATGETPVLRAMRRELTHRMGLGERKTAVLVTGRDRATGEPLRAYLADVSAMTKGSTRGFIGYERLERIDDEKLNTQGMVNLRACWEYNAQRAWEDRISFGCLGRPDVGCLEMLVPIETRSRAGGKTYVITAVRDSYSGKTKEYTGQIDAVDIDVLKGLAGKATGEG